jgi:hypothetical protein
MAGWLVHPTHTMQYISISRIFMPIPILFEGKYQVLGCLTPDDHLSTGQVSLDGLEIDLGL